MLDLEPPKVKSLSPRKEGNRPGLLAFNGDIAEFNDSFFTRSEVDGLADETLDPFLLPSVVDSGVELADFVLTAVGLTNLFKFASFLSIVILTHNFRSKHVWKTSATSDEETCRKIAENKKQKR